MFEWRIEEEGKLKEKRESDISGTFEISPPERIKFFLENYDRLRRSGIETIPDKPNPSRTIVAGSGIGFTT